MLKGNSKDQLANSIIRQVQTKPSLFWEKVRERKMFSLFHQAARKVPGYRDFLKKNKIKPEKIRNYNDLAGVPPVSKKNYLRQYPLKDLVWPEAFNSTTVFTSTSGSTGEPFYFPRGEELDWRSSIIHEIFLRQGTHNCKKPILIVNCFGMGVWIGGLITYKAFEIASRRSKHPLSIITPGINKQEIFNILKKLAPQYGQVLLAGYPPFIKDILDEAGHNGLDLKRLHLRLLFAAEPFTEGFRDHLARQIRPRNLLLDTGNVYGSADLGTMAYETPPAILIKRLALKKQALFTKIFSNLKKTPTLAQYNPLFTNFEAKEGNILITGDNALPLVRYQIGDSGGAFSFAEAENLLSQEGIDLRKAAHQAGISSSLYQLPFVYVYERNDFSTNLYGLQIYPEYIREALTKSPLDKHLTGKFTILTKFDSNHNQFLEVNLEMRQGKKSSRSMATKTKKIIIKQLIRKSSEYKELYGHLHHKACPKIVFWPAGHNLYFKQGVKQQWTQNPKK